MSGATRELPALTRPDGRRLAVCETGPAGAPIAALYLHGTGGSRLEVGAYAAAAQDAGVRLVAWDRPSHGGSARQIGRALLDVVPDLAAVAAEVGVARPAVLGLSGGGTHVVAIAATAPELIRRAVAINPGPPSDDAMIAALPTQMGGMLRMARTHPARFRRVAGILQSRNRVMLAIAKRQLDPLDRAIVFESPLRPIFEASAQEGQVTKGAWVEEAAMLWGAPWPFEIDGFTVPFDVFSGEADPFRPFAQRLHAASAAFHSFPGGHLSGFAPEVQTAILGLLTEPGK